jgi:proteasome lid subunit RPN8/RPN11
MSICQVRLSTEARTYNVVFSSSSVRVATQTTSSPRSQLDPQAVAAAEQHIIRTHTHTHTIPVISDEDRSLYPSWRMRGF